MASIYFFKFPLESSLGGAEFHTLKLAKHFQEQRKKVKLFTSDQYLFRLFEKHHLPRRRLFVGWEPTSKWSLLLWPLTYLIAKFKFRKLIKLTPPGSTLFMQSLTEKLVLTPLTLNPSPARGEGNMVKTIWLEHKIPGRWLILNPLKFRYLKLAKQVKLVTVSKFAKAEFVKFGVPGEKIEVIYPGTPSSLRLRSEQASPPIPTQVGIGGERAGVFTIGLLSRLDPEKGVLDFLKIIIPELPKHAHWQILIAGEGPEKEKIINLINKYNLGSRVKLLGFVNDLDDFFYQISVLVYPSKVAESFGMSVAEAQARGILIIASKIGALPELMEHQKSGFLVEKPQDWIEYLVRIDKQFS